MDAAEYKHVVLGLIFLKYISDTFEEHRAKLAAGKGDYAGANPEDQDEYNSENVFWVPKEARWTHLQANAKQPTIGKIVDDAMVAIERDNPRLKGDLPKDYARPGLDKHRLGELIDLIATITLIAASEGEKTHRSVDLLGRVYEYFLTRFASAEGKNGGQFYTPSCVVRCLVEMLAPHANSRIYDPLCGSGGMFVQSEKFIEEHGDQRDQVAIYGQESNATTRRLAVMNLAIRGFSADFGPEHADTFRRDLHPDLRADYVLANPPFNDSDWFRKDDDVRWQFGVPPKGNANFAWVQHFIHHLAPQGMAGFVLANGSMSSNQSGEGDIRRALIEADFVDCMVALPGQLFYSTQIPVCLWFLAKKKNADAKRGFHDTPRVDETVSSRMPEFLLKAGDIVFGRKGAVERSAQVQPDEDGYFLGSDGIRIRLNVAACDPKFISYQLQTTAHRSWMIQHAAGTTMPSLNEGIIRRIPIVLKPLAEQKAIAAVLGALDDKIELNRRMNATLEAMARALFQSWFVDFDPVRAKLDGRPPAALDPPTAALFPEHLEDSKLGHIPRGWRACTLGDIAKNVSITFDFKRTPEVVFINTGDVLEGDFFHSKRSSQVGLPEQAKKSIRPDDILFSEIRPENKRFAYVDFDSSNYVVSTKFMIIRGSKEIHPRLLYRILTAKETLDEFQVQAESRSGTFPQITFDSISHLPIVLPPIDIQEAFQHAVGKIDAQIKVNKQQSRTLATLRDTLLPKLLSGELSVAERQN